LKLWYCDVESGIELTKSEAAAGEVGFAGEGGSGTKDESPRFLYEEGSDIGIWLVGKMAYVVVETSVNMTWCLVEEDGRCWAARRDGDEGLTREVTNDQGASGSTDIMEACRGGIDSSKTAAKCSIQASGQNQ
jgi:hypothetical protein